MYTLNLSSVNKWLGLAGKWFPESVNVNCPFCSAHVNYKTLHHYRDEIMDTISCTSVCPNCGEDVYFWVIKPNDVYEDVEGCMCLAMFPAPGLPREPIEGAYLIPNERIKKAYKEVLDVFNANVWTATATLCRRTLEGIISDLIPKNEIKGGLASQLDILLKTVDLTKPIVTLSHQIRKAGNLGAHFDLEKEPDEKIASAMIDFIEYLLELFYTLPAIVEEFDKRLKKLGGKKK